MEHSGLPLNQKNVFTFIFYFCGFNAFFHQNCHVLWEMLDTGLNNSNRYRLNM